jgi:membrane-anchored mycosin MYCP
MRRVTARSAARAAACLLAVGGTCALLAGPAPSARADDTVCSDTPPDQRELAESRGPLPGLLRLDEAHEIATGRGIGIAVIDTGVAPGAPGGGRVDVRAQPGLPGISPRILDTHGTLVAGLVAGENEDGAALGVAPGARVVDIKVADARRNVVQDLDVPDPVTLESDRVAEAVRLATAQRKALGIRVINLSLNFDDRDPRLAAAVRDAIAKGIVVVAAVGNRPVDEDGNLDPDEAYEVGEDAVRFPATVPGVIGVTALGQDGTLDPTFVWTGQDVDVSAPVFNAATVNVGGTTCLLESVATSWAAAEVSGLAALVLERYGDLTPAQVATRIEATARGALQDDALDGHGMIQPLEALTAELDIAPDGKLNRVPAHQAPQRQPDPPPVAGDELAELRTSLLWWGLGAGGALVAALLLRPLLARRR